MVSDYQGHIHDLHQLVEPLSNTYTYLIACEQTRLALLIDPVVNSVERDLAEVERLGLTLAFTLDTHIHADHITGALQLKQRSNSRIAAPAMDRLPCTDVGIVEGTPLQIGSITVEPVHTPGHTDGHFAYVVAGRVFTGDALLIDGCGRTDFQNGSAKDLYRSVTEKLFGLKTTWSTLDTITTTNASPQSAGEGTQPATWPTALAGRTSSGLWPA